MKILKTKAINFYNGILLLFFIGIIAGCASSLSLDEKPGAMLWAENCGRCHNERPPTSLSDSEWDLAVFHMRTRANLTSIEAERITDFLKSSN
jgi:hypothetical protein